jgi:hypothetical protein
VGALQGATSKMPTSQSISGRLGTSFL